MKPRLPGSVLATKGSRNDSDWVIKQSNSKFSQLLETRTVHLL